MQTSLDRLARAILISGPLALAACGPDEPRTRGSSSGGCATQGCACTATSGCDAGLSCISERCDVLSTSCDATEQGDQRCVDDLLQSCSSGTWSTVQDCATIPGDCVVVGNNVACRLTGCPSGAWRCDGNAVQFCDGGAWDDVMNCMGGDVCVQASPSSPAVCEDPGAGGCSVSSGGDSSGQCHNTWNCGGTSYALLCDQNSNTCTCNGVGGETLNRDVCNLSNPLGTAETLCGWEIPHGTYAEPCTSLTSVSSNGTSTTCNYTWDCGERSYELNCNEPADTCSCNGVNATPVTNACNLSDAWATANTLCGYNIP